MRVQSKAISFKGQNIFVGIDVHLKTWAVTVLTESGGYKSAFTQPSSSKSLFEHLAKNYPDGIYHAVYESGFSGYSSCYELRELGVDCIVAHAADVPTSQKERLAKTDPVDSAKLARELRNGSLKAIYLPPKERLGDRELMRTRQTVMKDMRRVKSRIKHLLYNNGVQYPERFKSSRSHWTRAFIAWLQNDVELLSQKRMALDMEIEELLHLRGMVLKINRSIREMSRSDVYKDQYNLLIGIPGIGMITAMTVLTEIVDPQRFSSLKKFLSYLGLIPTMDNSGDTVKDGSITPRGNQKIRRMMIESAWTTIRYDRELAASFGNYSKYMKKNQAIVRIARKLAGRVWHVFKYGEEYKKCQLE